MSNKLNLAKAKQIKDDEFYTSLFDIMQELNRWQNKFAGKDIILPCDWQILDDKISSIMITFNPTRCFINTAKVKSVEQEFDLFKEFSTDDVYKEVSETVLRGLLEKRITCNFINYFLAVGPSLGIKSVTASGYDTITETGISYNNIDYTKYDICITNPPFSKYVDFMNCMLEARQNKKEFDFLLLSPFVNRVSPTVGVPLYLKQIYLGYGRHLAMSFKTQTTKTKSIAVDWITTWPEAQNELNNKHYTSGKTYDSCKHQVSIMENMVMKDGTRAIRVSGSDYPYDYTGWMFAGINVLDNLDQSRYEWTGTHFNKYFNKDHPEERPFRDLINDKVLLKVGDKTAFHGIVFRLIDKA